MSFSACVYIVLLGAATLAFAYAGIQWLLRKEPGQRLFWRDLAFILFTAFMVPGTIFSLDSDASTWWLLIPPFFLAFAFKRLLAAFSWKSVPLVRIAPVAAQGARKSAFKIVHLSDLHLCAAPSTLEGGLAREQVIEASRKALAWAHGQSPDLIAITGDVTDTGASAEWQIFESLLEELTPEWRRRVVFVPGNHDLAIQQRQYSGDNDGHTLMDYEARCRALVRSYFLHRPQNARVMLKENPRTEPREFEVDLLHEIMSKPLELQERFPPRAEGPGEMARHFGGRLLANLTRQAPASRKDAAWRRPLSAYVPGIVFPKELRESFGCNGATWPTEEEPLVQDLLFRLYPLVVFEDDRAIVIALNSNTLRSSWLADGALGELGERQVERLAAMLHARPRGKVVVLLVHHHIGCPPDVGRKIARTMVELKALQLHDGVLLAKALADHGAPAILLHGHKHAGYWAKAGRLTVVSAASVPYGDKLGGANCSALLVDEHGEVSMYESTSISCKST